ncbi:uncharacterized protein EMH_0029690 [Eimeria mitis]|uniref:Transmembrane protein n=1 Tax=Eimeria mitis TaxID=44415 RepID=U6KDM6_9EIME|nr:uncharacterized protein EMH_0029690 [Eimeria mitis]CDJ36059.1 hypothetical protein, conserved [Eimeria mitis]
MAPSISPFACSAVLARLALLLIFLQPLACLCHLNGPLSHSHASLVHAEGEGSGTASGGRRDASGGPHEQPGAEAHPWEATCGSYKSVTVRFPELHARATYDLGQVVQAAPPMGWTCKASEPLFELEEYPPFFQTVLSLMFGISGGSKGKNARNKLHKHKDKHVFFTFNPCRLLPHTCHGSRGRLFKFAAKLKKPHEPHEEIERLLADLLKVPPPSSNSLAAAETREEEADTTECLQNVLSTNTTMLYSYRDERLQQHPDSNGIGGLWSAPEITDDPTPWEPLNTNNPFEGLQAHMHHVHIFCPESSLHTHVVLKCPNLAGAADTAAAAGNAASATKFELCEHPDPCHFNMVLTTPAACPTLVDYSGGAAAAVPSAASATLLSGKLIPNSNTKEKDNTDKNNATPESHEQPAAKRDGGVTPAEVSGGAKHLPLTSGEHQKQSSRASAAPQEYHGVKSDSGENQDEGLWQLLHRLLLLCLRISVCALVFAWIIYGVRDWKETKLQYAAFPGEKSGEDAAAASANVNSYDSCVKALVEASSSPTSATDKQGFQLATKYTTGSPAATSTGVGDAASSGSAGAKVPRRELRGLYSSPARRILSVWLPQTIDSASRQALAFSEGAVNACMKLSRSFSSTRGAAGEFAQSDSGGNGMPWDWTDNVDFNDTDAHVHTPTDTPKTDVFRGLSGYETIS